VLGCVQSVDDSEGPEVQGNVYSIGGVKIQSETNILIQERYSL
jgi:hypothetical protein